VLRPDLVAGYDTELPGARAAVMARLLGAVDREPLPGLVSREAGAATFAGGVTVRFPVGAAMPFAPGEAGLAALVGGPAGGEQADSSPGRNGPGRGRPGRGGPGRGGPERDSPERGGETVVDDPAALARLLWGEHPFTAEVDNSVANLALARANRPRRSGNDLGHLEQLITDGHPLHPCCRTRGGMTVADVLAYAPEHSPVVRLRRLRVPERNWYGTAPPVLYAHPWQADRLRDRYPWLRDDGETGPARPLMSLRTVAPLDGGPHVKTAVDVQMTSAVRTVSPAAVHNGPHLSALLRTLTADLPLSVLAETAGGAVTVDGEPQRHLAFLRRAAPTVRPGEVVVPLAGFGAVPLLVESVADPYAWMELLSAKLFAPLTTLLDRGVALEAHGQNTLLVLRAGRPHRILYRDLGGVRVSPARLRAAGVEPPELRGDLPADDPRVLRTKLAAAALGTVAAELVTVFARVRGADPARLWALIAAAVRGTGTPDVPHLLRDPLPVKATTAMRLATDPLDDVWARLDNPLAAHS
jgi:ferric iron reductase FhuF-like transporter/IucA/IucC family protein